MTILYETRESALHFMYSSKSSACVSDPKVVPKRLLSSEAEQESPEIDTL